MSKSSFLTGEKPLLTCMVQANNPDRIKELVKLSASQGAEAFGMQFCKMRPEYRNKDTYKELFDFSSPLPVYATNYRNHGSNIGKSDDTLAKEVASNGITVNAVSPGTVNPTEPYSYELTQESTMNYMGRTGTPMENAELIAFLASKEAGYISGQNIQIDGCRKKI